MVNEQTLADVRAGMNIDVCRKTSPPGQHPGWEAPTIQPHPVRHTVHQHRVDAGIGYQYFGRVAGCGIPRPNTADIAAHRCQHSGRSFRLCVHDRGRHSDQA
jgi:hypothetical protein